MNVNEAYNLALSKLEDLRKTGAAVNITSSKDDRDESGELSRDKWTHVSIICRDLKQSTLMWNFQKELRDLGIYFNTGSSITQENDTVSSHDWELDWSFHVARS